MLELCEFVCSRICKDKFFCLLDKFSPSPNFILRQSDQCIARIGGGCFHFIKRNRISKSCQRGKTILLGLFICGRWNRISLFLSREVFDYYISIDKIHALIYIHLAWKTFDFAVVRIIFLLHYYKLSGYRMFKIKSSRLCCHSWFVRFLTWKQNNFNRMKVIASSAVKLYGEWNFSGCLLTNRNNYWITHVK